MLEGKEHDLWKLSGLSSDDAVNKILLPKKPGGYELRSYHSGRHPDAHHDRLIKLMDEIRDQGKSNGWTQDQFKHGFQQMLLDERQDLIEGKINIYDSNKQ